MKDVSKEKFTHLMEQIEMLEDRIESMEEEGNITEEILDPKEREEELQSLEKSWQPKGWNWPGSAMVAERQDLLKRGAE